MTENNGGPAFPYGVINCCPAHGDKIEPDQNGMTLRDWFAGMALNDMIRGSYCDGVIEKKLAKEAYGFADAMIAQREK